MPMHSTAIFHGCKIGDFQMKNCEIFSFAQNIDREYTLEPSNDRTGPRDVVAGGGGGGGGH